MQVAQALEGDPGTRTERRLLLQAVLRCTHAELAAHPERDLQEPERKAYQALLARRAAGEPVAYLVGEREFYGRSFCVTPAVLIPRPETEGLVDWALEAMAAEHAFAVLDLGTGSGALAVTLQSERPRWHITAVERSPGALAVARLNATRWRPAGSPGVTLLQGHWYGPVAGARFDLIVANPPYVAAGDPHLGQGDLRFEPPEALAAGAQGLDDLRPIITQAPRHLRPGGWLLVEHGADQEAACRTLFGEAGLAEVTTRTDLAGLPRLTGGRSSYPLPADQD